MTVMHKHHIVPRYRCKELGIDPDFEENIVEVTREQHALIHWGYQCGDLEPLLEVCDPSSEILEMISFGDNRDTGAAVILSQGEIDGVNQNGEKNPNYKHGLTNDPEWRRKMYEKHYAKNREKKLEYQRQYSAKNREKQKKYSKEYYEKNKEKELEYQQEYYQKNREKILEYQRQYSAKNREKKLEYKRRYNDKNREKKLESQRKYRAKKKAEKLAQQTGATLPL